MWKWLANEVMRCRTAASGRIAAEWYALTATEGPDPSSAPNANVAPSSNRASDLDLHPKSHLDDGVPGNLEEVGRPARDAVEERENRKKDWRIIASYVAGEPEMTRRRLCRA